MSTVQNGNTVTIHYTGTLNDGSEFDSSVGRDPLSFEVGSGQVIPGFDSAVLGMEEGESKTFTLTSDEAYGPSNPAAIQIVEKTNFPEDFEINVGQSVTGQNGDGQMFNATIVSEQDDTVTLDFNHPLAGKDLTFDIQLVGLAS